MARAPKSVRGATRVQPARQTEQLRDSHEDNPKTASYAKFTERSRLEQYVSHHYQSLVDAGKRLVSKPLASLITVICVAFSLFLPSLAFLLASSLDALLAEVDVEPTLSAYYQAGPAVKGDLSNHIRSLSDQVSALDSVRSTRIVSPDEALAGMRSARADAKSDDGLGLLVDALGENPLPWRLDIELSPSVSNEQLSQLRALVLNDRSVSQVVYDQVWRERLLLIKAGLTRLGWLFAAFFSLGMVAMFSAALRALIQSRHDEIRLLRLIGATPARIRRPFLYAGALLGLLASVLVIVTLMLVDGLAISQFEAFLASYQLSGDTLNREFLPISAVFVLLLILIAVLGGVIAAMLVARGFLNEPED